MDDGDNDSNLVVEITPLANEKVSSENVVSVVLADILNSVHKVSDVSVDNEESTSNKTPHF